MGEQQDPWICAPDCIVIIESAKTAEQVEFPAELKRSNSAARAVSPVMWLLSERRKAPPMTMTAAITAKIFVFMGPAFSLIAQLYHVPIPHRVILVLRVLDAVDCHTHVCSE